MSYNMYVCMYVCGTIHCRKTALEELSLLIIKDSDKMNRRDNHFGKRMENGIFLIKKLTFNNSS